VGERGIVVKNSSSSGGKELKEGAEAIENENGREALKESDFPPRFFIHTSRTSTFTPLL